MHIPFKGAPAFWVYITTKTAEIAVTNASMCNLILSKKGFLKVLAMEYPSAAQKKVL
jgi:hypothetical protein